MNDTGMKSGEPSDESVPKDALHALRIDSELERLEGLLAEFNLFDMLGIARSELQHSRVVAWLLVPSPPDIGTSIRNELNSGTSYSEGVAEYDRIQVQS